MTEFFVVSFLMFIASNKRFVKGTFDLIISGHKQIFFYLVPSYLEKEILFIKARGPSYPAAEPVDVSGHGASADRDQ